MWLEQLDLLIQHLIQQCPQDAVPDGTESHLQGNRLRTIYTLISFATSASQASEDPRWSIMLDSWLLLVQRDLKIIPQRPDGIKDLEDRGTDEIKRLGYVQASA